MQTIVDRKVTNTKWTDDLKENDAEVHFHFKQNSLLTMRLHMIAFLQETHCYMITSKNGNALKTNTFLSSSKGSCLIWIQTVLKGYQRTAVTDDCVEKRNQTLSSQAAKAHIRDCTRSHSQRKFCRIQVQVPCGESLLQCNDSKKRVYEIRHLLKRQLKSMEDNVVHFIFFHFIPKCDLFSINIYYIIKALS